MNINFKPIHYHDTVSEDGITHHVVIGERKTAYQIHLHDTFWGCDDELTAKALLIQELKIVKKQLENELNSRLSFYEVENEIHSISKSR